MPPSTHGEHWTNTPTYTLVLSVAPVVSPLVEAADYNFPAQTGPGNGNPSIRLPAMPSLCSWRKGFLPERPVWLAFLSLTARTKRWTPCRSSESSLTRHRTGLKNCFRLSTVSWSGLDWAQQPTGAPIPNAI